MNDGGSMAPTTFAVVGSGKRSRFFLRMAEAAPDRLRAVGIVSRNPERAPQGVLAVRTLDELLAHERPDFVAAAVPWPQMPDTARAVVAAGLPVLVETPPAPDLDGLRSLWADVGASGLVQVAEQYLLMPGHAARLAAVRGGIIGDPTAVHVCSTHLYHAVSLVRGLLGLDMDDVTVSARAFSAPLTDPLGFDGWRPDPAPQPRTRTIATLDFGDGRHGLYDFTENQWWNPLLARRISVRGTTGELVDDRIVRLVEPQAPVESQFVYRRLGIDLNLEGNELDHVSLDGRVLYRNPFRGTRLSEDDIGVAAILEATGAWARDEAPAPYPLAQGCQDHAISLAIGESARTGQDVRVAKEVWV
ncbi:Gfo/Idh/MocA family protein [Pseudonocardia zijingensis]